MIPRWEFNWLTSWDEIWDSRFVAQWQSWLDTSPSTHVFFHPALVRAWVDTYLPLRDIRPYFLVARSDKTFVFLPLVLWRRNWKNAFQKLLIPVGYSDYDYHDPIISGDDNILSRVGFWEAFIQGINFKSKIKCDRVFIDGVRDSNDAQTRCFNFTTSCPFIDLERYRGMDDYLLTLKGKFRNELKRRERRIKEAGNTEFSILSESSDTCSDEEIENFVRFHSLRWPKAFKAKNFHRNVIRYSAEAGICYFSKLTVGGVSAAWHLSFLSKKRYYSYMPAQTENFIKYSPGNILTLKCIEDAFNKGVKIFDFLRGEESYKAGWTDKSEPLFSFQLDSKKFTSRMKNSIVDKAKPAVQKLLP